MGVPEPEVPFKPQDKVGHNFGDRCRHTHLCRHLIAGGVQDPSRDQSKSRTLGKMFLRVVGADSEDEERLVGFQQRQNVAGVARTHVDL